MWIGFAALRRASSIGGPPSDADAVALATAGDGGGVTALYDRYARVVYSLALRIVRIDAEAEDVVQDVFAQVFRQADRYDAAIVRDPSGLLVQPALRFRLRSVPDRTAGTDPARHAGGGLPSL